jgi:hypothetical protein
MSKTTAKSAAVIGRRVGIAIFWLMAVFVIFASTRSVLAQLYGHETSAGPVQANERRCADELRALERSLLDHAADELRLPRDRSRVGRWLAEWDRRYAALEGTCGSLTGTRRELFSLREDLEALLHERERRQRPLTERIERALDRFETRS